jgi:hypothetical protein
MTEAVLRKEIHGIIDAIPGRSLYALKPLLTVLAAPAYYTIETDLTPEEIAIIDEGIQEFREHPQNYISLKDYLAGNA